MKATVLYLLSYIFMMLNSQRLRLYKFRLFSVSEPCNPLSWWINALNIKSSEFIQSTNQTNNIHDLNLPVFVFLDMLGFWFHYMGSRLLANLCVWFHSFCQTMTALCFVLWDFQWIHLCRTFVRNSLMTTITRLPFSLRLNFAFFAFPFVSISSDPKLKTALTRSECFV